MYFKYLTLHLTFSEQYLTEDLLYDEHTYFCHWGIPCSLASSVTFIDEPATLRKRVYLVRTHSSSVASDSTDSHGASPRSAMLPWVIREVIVNKT